MRRLSLASATTFAAVFCLLTLHQPANAKGCLQGTMLGGIAGHMTHHTFLGIFGGARVEYLSTVYIRSGRKRIQTGL